eukprot:13561589-Heterocapsa_arctica.AAC.1
MCIRDRVHSPSLNAPEAGVGVAEGRAHRLRAARDPPDCRRVLRLLVGQDHAGLAELHRKLRDFLCPGAEEVT